MSLLRGTVNPLNVLGIRKLKHIPPHFGRASIKTTVSVSAIDFWIYGNLNSRYCVKRSQKVDEQNKIVDVIELGLEDPRELTMFLLGCPHLEK